MSYQHTVTPRGSMSFNQDFEAQVNDNMSPPNRRTSYDIKGKRPVSITASSEAEDREFNEKMAIKDQGSQDQLPPRFSTIFDTKGPATPPRAFESYPQQPARKSGIYIAKPFFWALFAILMLESALLFAYTVIGLINNMSSKLVHVGGSGAVMTGCDCNAQPINILPNFFMPQGSLPAGAEPTTVSTLLAPSSTSTSTPAPTTSTSSSSEAAKANLSQLVDVMKSAAAAKTSSTSTSKPSTSVTVVTPQETVSSTVLLTVDPSGSTIKPRPTVTSTTFVEADEPTPTLNTRDEPTSGESDSSQVKRTISLELKSHHDLAVKPTIKLDAAPSATSHSDLADLGNEDLLYRGGD